MRRSLQPTPLIIVCTLILVWCPQAFGQSSDSQFFQVTVNESISLHSPGDVVISHDLSNDNQVFPEQAWTAHTTNTNGASVDFTIGKFIHEDFFFFRRNARIDLRVIDSSPNASWGTNVSTGQTTGFLFGNQTASVSAESFGPGGGILGIRVSFIEFNNRFLAGGRYNATVVGQITNK